MGESHFIDTTDLLIPLYIYYQHQMTSEIPTLFESCVPHDDVLSGTLSENEFAAKLSDVVFRQDQAPDIYGDPDTFFSKTYPTNGLQDLLTLLAKRYAGKETGEFSGADGLLSLDTVFGGGKTHSQIAAYHFSQNPGAIEDLSKYILDDDAREQFEGIKDDLSVRTAVFEGGYVSATNAKCVKHICCLTIHSCSVTWFQGTPKQPCVIHCV